MSLRYVLDTFLEMLILFVEIIPLLRDVIKKEADHIVVMLPEALADGFSVI